MVFALAATALMSWMMVAVEAAGRSYDGLYVSPNRSAVWYVGGTYAIEWTPSFVLPGGLYFNNYTRLSIELRDARSPADQPPLHLIAHNVPIALASILFTIPTNISGTTTTTTTGSTTTTAHHGPKYCVLIYPSFFDWPGACDGCKRSASCGPAFSIIRDEAFIAAVERSPVSAQHPNDFHAAVQAVGIGVGVTALVAFGLVVLVYARRRKDAWARRADPYAAALASSSSPDRLSPRRFGALSLFRHLRSQRSSSDLRSASPASDAASDHRCGGGRTVAGSDGLLERSATPSPCPSPPMIQPPPPSPVDGVAVQRDSADIDVPQPTTTPVQNLFMPRLIVPVRRGPSPPGMPLPPVPAAAAAAANSTSAMTVPLSNRSTMLGGVPTIFEDVMAEETSNVSDVSSSAGPSLDTNDAAKVGHAFRTVLRINDDTLPLEAVGGGNKSTTATTPVANSVTTDHSDDAADVHTPKGSPVLSRLAWVEHNDDVD